MATHKIFDRHRMVVGAFGISLFVAFTLAAEEGEADPEEKLLIFGHLDQAGPPFVNAERGGRMIDRDGEPVFVGDGVPEGVVENFEAVEIANLSPKGIRSCQAVRMEGDSYLIPAVCFWETMKLKTFPVVTLIGNSGEGTCNLPLGRENLDVLKRTSYMMEKGTVSYECFLFKCNATTEMGLPGEIWRAADPMPGEPVVVATWIRAANDQWNKYLAEDSHTEETIEKMFGKAPNLNFQLGTMGEPLEFKYGAQRLFAHDTNTFAGTIGSPLLQKVEGKWRIVAIQTGSQVIGEQGRALAVHMNELMARFSSDSDTQVPAEIAEMDPSQLMSEDEL